MGQSQTKTKAQPKRFWPSHAIQVNESVLKRLLRLPLPFALAVVPFRCRAGECTTFLRQYSRAADLVRGTPLYIISNSKLDPVMRQTLAANPQLVYLHVFYPALACVGRDPLIGTLAPAMAQSAADMARFVNESVRGVHRRLWRTHMELLTCWQSRPLRVIRAQ